MSNTPLFILLITLTAMLMLALPTAADPVVVSGGPENDYESSIIRLNDGRLMVVLCRNPDWASGDLYATFSSDDGCTWDEPQPILTIAGDQATLSFVQMPDSTIRLFYASDETDDYKIHYAWSDDGLNWQFAGPVDLGWDDGRRYYDPTVILEPDGSLTMSYIVTNSGVFVAHCPSGGAWDLNRTRVSLAGYRARIMKHQNGTYLCAYHMRTGGPYEYDVFVRSSTDLVNWSDSVQITYNFNSHDPYVCEMPDGAFMIYYAKYEGMAYNLYRRKSYDAINWGDEQQITFDDSHNSTQPHFFTEGMFIYLVWAYAVNFPFDHDVYFEKFEYTTGIDDRADLAENYEVKLNNYPNPFNASTKISFTLAQPRAIKLDIYNILGQHVETLLDCRMPAGQHQVIWEAGSQSSGIYFARLRLLEQTEHLKLLLLK